MTTVRLSNYQKNVLEEAKKRIDRARSCKSIYEYLTEVLHLNDRIINILKNDNPETLKMYTDEDRKSTRLNSSHVSISYAVFGLKKKKIIYRNERNKHEGNCY